MRGGPNAGWKRGLGIAGTTGVRRCLNEGWPEGGMETVENAHPIGESDESE